MPSKLLRRSGQSVVNVCNFYQWRPDTVFQVGIGLHCEEVDVMRENWEGVKFYGCEPNPAAARSLRKTYPGKVYETAVGNDIGSTTLYGKRRHKGGSSIHQFKEHNDKDSYYQINVDLITLDYLLCSHGNYGSEILLWLDCEGSELAALEGGEQFIESVRMINVEMTEQGWGHDWAKPIQVHDFLLDRGFGRIWVHTIRGSICQYDAIYLRTEFIQPEFCMCPCTLEYCK